MSAIEHVSERIETHTIGDSVNGRVADLNKKRKKRAEPGMKKRISPVSGVLVLAHVRRGELVVYGSFLCLKRVEIILLTFHWLLDVA